MRSCSKYFECIYQALYNSAWPMLSDCLTAAVGYLKYLWVNVESLKQMTPTAERPPTPRWDNAQKPAADLSAHVTRNEMKRRKKSVRVCVLWPASAISVLLGNYITFLLLNISERPLSAALIHVHRSLAAAAVISKSQILLTWETVTIC